MIALQYHQVEIKVTFKDLKDVVAFPGYEYDETSQTLANDDSTKSALQSLTSTPFVHATHGLAKKREVPKARDYPLEDVKLMCNLVYLEEEER